MENFLLWENGLEGISLPTDTANQELSFEDRNVITHQTSQTAIENMSHQGEINLTQFFCQLIQNLCHEDDRERRFLRISQAFDLLSLLTSDLLE